MEQFGAPCFHNPQHEAHVIKKQWIKEQFSNGLTIKHLFIEGEKKACGFIEYISGENTWRAVDAENYLFIHCIWITPNKYKEKGFGSILLQECINDAKNQGKFGVVTVSSEGTFIAGKELFVKNNFKQIDQSDRFELMVHQIKPGKPPQFRDYATKLREFQGLHLLYSDQCPWVSRSILEFEQFLKEKQIPYSIVKYRSAKEAQQAPPIYATFNLVYNGKLLVDHYVSLSRFQNILVQENLLKSKTLTEAKTQSKSKSNSKTKK